MQTIHAIYENGVFRPVEKVDLPDHCEVEVDVRPGKPPASKPSLDEVYELLSQRFHSGEGMLPLGMTSTSHDACLAADRGKALRQREH